MEIEKYALYKQIFLRIAGMSYLFSHDKIAIIKFKKKQSLIVC